MVGCSWLELWLLSQCGGVFYYKAYLYISRRSIQEAVYRVYRVYIVRKAITSCP